MPSPGTNVELFVRLSKALTGVSYLDPSLASGLLTRIEATLEGKAMDSMLSTFESIERSGGDQVELIREKIMQQKEPENLHALARMIIVLWYTGDLSLTVTQGEVPTGPTEEQYFGGVLWRVIRAHPPGLSGGYFGHWRYPPDSG